MKITRNIGYLDWVANEVKEIKLPREHFIEEIALHGDFTVTTDDSTGTVTVKEDEIFGIIKRLDIVANGKDTLVSLAGEELWFLNRIQYKVAPLYTALTNVDGTGKDASFHLKIRLTPGLGDLRGAYPSFRFSDLICRITFGAITDLYTLTGAATASVVTTSKLRFEVTEVVRTAQNQNANVQFLQKISSSKDTTSVSGQSGNEIELPVGLDYRGILCVVRDNSVRSATFIDNWIIRQDGITPHIDRSSKRQLGEQTQLYLGALPTGVFYLNFWKDGLPDFPFILRTKGWSKLEVVPNASASPTATSTIAVIPIQHIPFS